MVKELSTFKRICMSDAFTAFVVCAAIFSDSFVYDLIIPFIPQMLEHRLDLPRDQVQLWTSTLLGVFGVFFALGNIVAGYLTDSLPSKKTPFLLGTTTMIASSLMFFLGRHIAITVTARALQGLSASFVWVSGLAFLNSQIKPSYIGTAMGYVSLGTAVGEFTGPVVGGVMYEHAGHFSVLGLVCVILGLDILLRLMLVDKPSDDRQQTRSLPDDETRPLMNGETIDETESSAARVTDTQSKIELKQIDILGFQLDSDLCASFYAACIIGTIRYSFETALAVFVIQRFEWSTSASGGILFAFLSPAVFGPIVGHFTTKYGPRWISVILFGIVTFALVALGFCTHTDNVTQILFVIIVAVAGICVSSLVTVQSIAFSVAAKRREIKAKQDGKSDSTGTAFGSFSLAWTVGMFVGPLAAEVFVDHVNWLAFCLFLAALSAVSAGVMIFTCKHWEIPEED